MDNDKYAILIYWSEEYGLFVAEVPELAGCLSDGNSYSEALENVQVFINEWVETAKSLNREIPKPRGKLLIL